MNKSLRICGILIVICAEAMMTPVSLPGKPEALITSCMRANIGLYNRYVLYHFCYPSYTSVCGWLKSYDCTTTLGLHIFEVQLPHFYYSAQERTVRNSSVEWIFRASCLTAFIAYCWSSIFVFISKWWRKEFCWIAKIGLFIPCIEV